MNSTDKYHLWQVTKICDLSDESELVRNDLNGRLMVRRFMSPDSFRILQKLTEIRQKNLMEVYDCMLTDKRCVCLCEYIEGETIEQRIERNGAFGEEQTKRIVSQLCDALTALHGAGIIHRDVTATNVMLTSGNTVKLIDYDIARTVRENAAADTQILGTVGYASPEQFGFSQTGVRADIYACGALMNYMLTGALPNEKRYPGPLSKVIGSCIEIDEQKRYGSAVELKQSITGKRYRSPEQLGKRFRPLPGFRSKHLLPKILTTVAILAYGLMVIIFFKRMSENFDRAVKKGWSASLQKDIYQDAMLGLVFLVLLTLIPYLCFGDVGRLSRKISPKDYSRGEWLMKMFGWLSIAAAFAVISFVNW